MPYTIKLSESSDYILIKVTGPLNTAISMEYTSKSHILGKEKGIDRFLVDLTESVNTETPLENFNFAESELPINTEINRKARVAILVDPADHSHDFFETLAVNRGHNLRIFRDKKAIPKYFGIKSL